MEAALSNMLESPVRVKVFVPYHKSEVLDRVPDAPFLSKILLGDLKVDPPEYQTNLLGEHRLMLSEMPVGDENFVGMLNGRSPVKYARFRFRWDTLPERITALPENGVLACWKAAPDWQSFTERNHRGMGALLDELCGGIGLESCPTHESLWANDFACRRDVWDDWRIFWRRCFDWMIGKYGLEIPIPTVNMDSARKPAYFMERFTTLYFATRSDLRIIQY